MIIPKGDITTYSKDRGYRGMRWKVFQISAFLQKVGGTQKRWYYKMYKMPGLQQIFEVTAYGLPWNEKRFRESISAAIDYKDNARKVIKALFDDFSQ